MNIQECDIMNCLLEKPYVNQRILADECGHSLGVVNRSIRNLTEEGYIDSQMRPTDSALQEARRRAPKNAVILAAGYGVRMVPINMETPKGLLEVHGEPLVERIIRQLHEAGVRDIRIVVGFMKERYEYLIDEYGVELVVNADYAARNNLHSLKRVVDWLSNTYVIPCDIWCEQNPFHRHELYSWYMVSDRMSEESSVRVNRRMELTSVPADACGNAMIGICYLLEEQAAVVREKIAQFCADSRHDGDFWEETLYDGGRMIVQARVVRESDAVEINTYEQLRELDEHSNQLESKAIAVIAGALNASPTEVRDIAILKKGMTNRSFLFSCRGKRYIMRIPGEGTDRLINRRQEAAVYRKIAGQGLCDDVVYINAETGYKITGYLENARTCDPLDAEDLRRCMEKLRAFHELGLTVEHEFDLFGQIAFYESLWNGEPSIYRDYARTKENVWSLKAYIDRHAEPKVLTHIDAIADNFLFAPDGRGGEQLRLIDWEYAGMQDPHVDIAMFCIYSMYDREQVDQLIRLYFPSGCPDTTRIKIYCYIAVCGLLWSNWCEYKRQLGVEFGEYSLRQYRFAKDYYRIAREELKRMEEKSACTE